MTNASSALAWNNDLLAISLMWGVESMLLESNRRWLTPDYLLAIYPVWGLEGVPLVESNWLYCQLLTSYPARIKYPIATATFLVWDFSSVCHSNHYIKLLVMSWSLPLRNPAAKFPKRQMRRMTSLDFFVNKDYLELVSWTATNLPFPELQFFQIWQIKY